MADKDKKTLERVYNVPLRKEYMKVARWKRTKKAITALKQFLAKHMKSEDVKLSTSLNEEMWKHGIKNPPHHIKIVAKKDNEGKVTAELFGKEKEQNKEQKKTLTNSKGSKKKEEPKKEESKVKSEEKVEKV